MEAPLLFFALFVRKAFVLMCPYGEERYSLFLDTAAAICYTEWSEYQPALYFLLYQIDEQDNGFVSFGMRKFCADGTRFTINGKPTMLRGKHDGMIFPRTGYAPTDVNEWIRILQTAKDYGINHYRFHTCCPPDAAFTAADLLGIYMEPELLFWGTIAAPGEEGYQEAEQQYLIALGDQMLDAFGNHPSFVMFSLGNELWGSPERLGEILRHYKARGSRRLYTQGCNNFQHFPLVLPEDDYFVGVRLSKERLIRGSYGMCDAPLGHVQTDRPSTMHQYDTIIFPEQKEDADGEAAEEIEIQYGTGVKKVKVSKSAGGLIPTKPVITHEIGQYEVYPNFREIEKYTGPLKARNFEIFRERLAAKGMLSQAEDFFQCSGALAAACYKEEIEAAMRSQYVAGFQLLDLQDFSGQGTALVGMLDAFMESKGLITPEEWRMFCSDCVLLAQFPSYTLISGEMFTAKVSMRTVLPQDGTVEWVPSGMHQPAVFCGRASGSAMVCEEHFVLRKIRCIPAGAENDTGAAAKDFSPQINQVSDNLQKAVQNVSVLCGFL